MSIWLILLIKVFSTLESSSDWGPRLEFGKAGFGFSFYKTRLHNKASKMSQITKNISIFQLKIVKKGVQRSH